jgi:RNA polymerase sigma-70 factor (ECF subfamily)
MPDLSDQIRAAQSGHELAFRVVYQAVQPGLLRYLSSLVGDEAEDIASEAWGQIVRDLRSFRGDAMAFRAWTATIARHRALDHLRRMRRRPVTVGLTAEVLERSSDADTEALALQAVSTDRAIALIASLPREMAEAVLLRAVIGLDAEAAGRVLGKRPGAVRTAAYRGLHRLAAVLREANPPGGRPPVARPPAPYRSAAAGPAPRLNLIGRADG